MNDDCKLTPEELNALLQEYPEPGAESMQDLKLRLALDFPLEVSIRLGEAKKNIGELLQLASGTVIELDREITEPVDLVVNGRTIARGEVITVGEYFAVRIVSIIKPEERIENLGAPGR